MDINKFISNQIKAFARNDLIGMLADVGHALVQTGLKVNGARHQDMLVGPLLMQAAAALEECWKREGEGLIQPAAKPENPGDVVVKIPVPDHWPMTEAGQRRAAQEAAAPKPVTNGDRIRAMTDEALADSEFCKVICDSIPRCPFGGVDTCRECRIKWLGSPVKEENDGKSLRGAGAAGPEAVSGYRAGLRGADRARHAVRGAAGQAGDGRRRMGPGAHREVADEAQRAQGGVRPGLPAGAGAGLHAGAARRRAARDLRGGDGAVCRAASLRPGDRLHKKKGVRIPMRTRGRPRRHKPRLCRCCGREMEPTQVWICASCEAAGRTIPRARGVQSGAELLAIARAREAAEEPILEGWGLDEIEALARYLWDNGAKAYGSYGKLRGWCDNVGRLPPLPEGL